MSPSYWGRIERGSIDPGVRMVVRVATALETTATTLMEGTHDLHPAGS